MHPDNAFPVEGMKVVDKEACAAQQHVGYALNARKRIVDAAGSGEELMLAHIDPFAAIEMDGEDMARAVATEAQLTGTAGFGEEDGHSRQDPLKSALQGPDADADTEILPEKDVVLKVNGHAPEFEMKHRNKVALDMVGDSGKRFCVSSGGSKNRDWHSGSQFEEGESHPMMHGKMQSRKGPGGVGHAFDLGGMLLPLFLPGLLIHCRSLREGA
jgi:hypothetical protein